MHDVASPRATKKLPHTTAIKIGAKERATLVDMLNQQLANMSDLHSQTKQAHWNVRGAEFFQVHKLFDELAEPFDEFIDMLAERVVTLGGVAHGTVRGAAKNSELEEFPDEPGEMNFVQELAARYGFAGNSVRSAIDRATDLGDLGSADLLTDIVRELDKSLYFLEAHFRK